MIKTELKFPFLSLSACIAANDVSFCPLYFSTKLLSICTKYEILRLLSFILSLSLPNRWCSGAGVWEEGTMTFSKYDILMHTHLASSGATLTGYTHSSGANIALFSLLNFTGVFIPSLSSDL